MDTVKDQTRLLYNLGSYSKKKLQRDLTPLQQVIYRFVTRNRDIVVETKGRQNRYANLLLPTMLRVRKHQPGIRAMIITSEPEDVKNTAEYFDSISRQSGAQKNHVRVVQLGSIDSARQEAARISDDPEVIIGTPERVIDHIRRNHLDLSHIRMSVIDEPDVERAPGFNADLEYIYAKLPRRTQSCVFVETIHEEVPTVTALLRHPSIINRVAWEEKRKRSESQRPKENRAVKKQKDRKKSNRAGERLDGESIARALKDIVRHIHHNEDPSELNWLRKQVRKNVSLFNRAYVAAYLLREQLNGGEAAPRVKAANGSKDRQQSDDNDYTSVFVGVGKNRHVYPKDLVELFTQVNGIGKSEIGQIKILDNYSFVEIAGPRAQEAIGELNGKEYRGRKLNVNYAKKKDD